ncbi:hypothetical protein APR50_39715 [Variovorax paradoxus]|uniref:hypothetical protein n=1 Tax=Variovorax TaxID=34072 RepID=UPI0006E5A879|nr:MULTISPECIES: hypothetical protein [unclassified Variovorax]KPU88341.1 hypothetical protein APR52_42635 [Variovorax paradoxus]KPU92490.1 hypothetical protein APR50_39715 [Variovorax paradoxus]KPV01064.1 hypothetical protein APR49_32350 [Variovorax paradoxus]KPV21000.1 hypothetical protein APR51_15025 [Variovorax paradoxus]KPV21071.1 hypothetical protein APR48_38290 [Variovorax paradoxus]
MNPSPDFHLQLARLGAQIDSLQRTLHEVMRHGVLLHGDGAREKLLARDQYLALEAAIREQELRDSPALRAVRSVCAACAAGAQAPSAAAMPDRADDADGSRSRGVSDSIA